MIGEVETDYPELRRQIRMLAAKRAARFGVPVDR